MNGRPGTQDTAEVLRRRAEALARPSDETKHRRAEMVVAVVALSGERYGLPARALREIIRAPGIVTLPGLPPWIVGVLAVRGEILCAIDLAGWLGLAPAAEPRFLAVVESPRGSAGLLVEGVLGLREIHADDLADSMESPQTRSGIVQATTRDLVSILDLAKLLDRNDLVVGGDRHSAREPDSS